MKGVQLKLQGEWLAMPFDFSLKLEQTNPLFNEQGIFSFPFEVPLNPNRHIFKNIADPFGKIRLEDIDGMQSELWFNGILLYRGIIETDEEVEFEDNIPMTFISGNADFMHKIEDLKTRDIPLDRDIKLGYVVNRITSLYLSSVVEKTFDIDTPEQIMMNYTELNVSDPYPIKEYCNVRVCTSNEFGKYKTLEARRPFSGVCFYVMYLIDCLLKHLSISVGRNNVINIEDINRIAFFTTQCDIRYSENEYKIPLSEIRDKSFLGPDFKIIGKVIVFRGSDISERYDTENITYYAKEVFATNLNYPDVFIKDVIKDLENAFGIRFLYDNQSNSIDLIFIKDILKNNEVEDLVVDVLSVNTIRVKKGNVKLSYGNESDVSFNYADIKNAVLFDGYEAIVKKGVSIFDKTWKIDKLTGNSYKVRVNKDTGLDPTLFEVGGFRDYVSTNSKQKDKFDDIAISYSPIVVNDVSGSTEKDQLYAIFVNEELQSTNEFNGDIGSDGEAFLIKDEESEYGEYSLDVNMTAYINKAIWHENYDIKSNNESPLRSYDAGYSLGIMRGPGHKSGIEYYNNYDGEGNDSWKQTSSNYAFTSDSCDNYGRFFDYNGKEPGGIDQSGRISLKLIAGKDGISVGSEYANRGLVDKFLAEYFYFIENRNTVIMEVEMSITQLINIDFLKRYKIGNFVGFINSISYSLTSNGMEDVLIEMYTL